MSAFSRCTGLTSIVIPGSVMEIGDSAFGCCKGLKSVMIEGKLKKIPEYAFSSCSSLESVTLPAGIGNIHLTAFDGCTALKTINVPAKKMEYYMKRLPFVLQGLIVEQEQKCNEKPKQTTKGKRANNSSIMNVSDYNGYILGLSVYREAITCKFIIKDGKAVIVEGWGIEGAVDLPRSIDAKTKKEFFNKLARILLKYLCEQFPDYYLPKRIKEDHATAVVEVFLGEEVWYSDLTSAIK